jgi:hypothetical protein
MRVLLCLSVPVCLCACACACVPVSVPVPVCLSRWVPAHVLFVTCRALFREHLGLAADDEDAALLDPVDHGGYTRLWVAQALRNTAAYRAVFHCIPDDTVATWSDYRDYVSTMPLAPGLARALLRADVHGHVVHFPARFLCRENLLSLTLTNSENLVRHHVFL